MSARLIKILQVIILAAAVSAVFGGCGVPESGNLGQPVRNPLSVDPASPTSADQDSLSQFREAVNMVADLKYEAALPKLLTVSIDLEGEGDRARAAEAMFWLGYCHEKLNRHQDALDTYARIIKDYPATTAAKQANLRLTRLTPETD